MEPLATKLKLSVLRGSENLAEKLSAEDLGRIGHRVVANYEIDEQSRVEWRKKNKQANELALQITEEKTHPWEGASNVKFPLLTIAAIQFLSRAYPALVKAPDLVKYRVQGSDPSGQKAARAQRIGAHMSYQLLDENEAWEEDHDRALLALPIVGCVFKKSYRKDINCSELVLPNDLCVHYYAQSLERCERKTHIFKAFEREIREMQLAGRWLEQDLGYAEQDGPTAADKRQGTQPPIDDEDRSRKLLEQHAYLDLDQDGYKEPYIITVDHSSKKVLAIYSRFREVVTEQSLKIQRNKEAMREIVDSLQEGEVLAAARAEQAVQRLADENEMLAGQAPKVLKITAFEHFTKIPFIPSPDGGFYDIGFGALLGPLNDSVDTLINQLVDSGTMQNGSSGFIGKGARIKGGKLRFSPNEWKRVDVAGSVLRDSLVPLPINTPSPVLFNLLGLLINYTERVSSVTDAMSGENPGQNTPAYTMSAMLEQGMQVFNGIFKRVYRAFRSEVRKLYELNALYLDEQAVFEYHDDEMEISRADYQGPVNDLIPAADPNAFSNKEKQIKAGMIAERAMLVPGYDKIKVEQRFLESMDVPDAAQLFPVQKNPETGAMELVYPPPEDPEFQIKAQEEARRTMEAKDRAEVNYMLAASKIAVDEATILKLMAEAELAADGPELARMQMMVDDLQDRRKTLLEMAKLDKTDAGP